MPSSALGVDVVREIRSHDVIFRGGVKLQDYARILLECTPEEVVTCTGNY
jgi:hypothetical protein